jgi:hypothetical protein|tara:strand:- start:559 stop:723 length:165 start_codon:yes stop_codon:yes gene_type:complete
MKQKGLGDTIDIFTTYTGIKKVVEKINKATNTDCGCGRRKDTLNKKFPYVQTKK